MFELRQWSGVGKVVSAVSGNVWPVACVVAVLGVVVQQVRIEGMVLRPRLGAVGVTLIDLAGWRPRALAAEQALAQIRAAQPVAAAAQAAVNHQPAAMSAAIAKVSDDDAQAYYRKGGAAGAAYAVDHRVGGLCAAPAERVAGDADLPGADHLAAQHDGTGGDAGMVAVSRADFDQLTANSLRLAKVHQDAESLIAAGVAVGAEGR